MSSQVSVGRKQWVSLPFPKAVRFQEGPGVRNWQFRTSGIKLVNVRNIVDGELDLSNTDRHLDSAEVKSKYSHFLLEEGDFVLSSSGVTWGKIAEVRKEHLPLCLNTSIIRIIPQDSTVLDKRYLRIFIESHLFRNQIVRLITGSAQPNFGPSHLEQLQIPLPPLPEQKRIAEILDRAEALRAKRRDALAQLDTLTQSIFLEMFGDPIKNEKKWPRLNIGTLASKIGSGSTPTGGDAAYKAEGISLIRSLNVRDGEFTFKDLAHIDESQAARLANVVVSEDDVLLNITGASVARVCRAPVSVLPARVNQHVMIIRPTSGLTSRFLEQCLLNSSTKRMLLGIAESGATRQAITKAQVEALEIPVPPRELQVEFARRAAAVEKLKTAHRQSLQELDSLFASLQSRAFRGEL